MKAIALNTGAPAIRFQTLQPWQRNINMQPVFTSPTLRVVRLILGTYGTNTYILTCLRTSESLVIDAPEGEDEILKNLRDTRPRAILLTHAHFDHTGALLALKGALDVPVVAHRDDGPRLPLKADHSCEDGEKLPLGALAIEVLHTPGHTPGSLCFGISGLLFAGDTLFPGGPGRTQSPSDFRQILDSLSAKIFPLPDETRVFPGHGEPTTLKAERAAFEAFRARHPNPQLCGDVLWASS
jgi:glyoxylase-like metal-dependent hydrolase (beta-lactamase superfamily II)